MNGARAVEYVVIRVSDGEVPDGLILRTDNAPQYISQQFRRAMNILGIKLEYIQERTPEDNGNIESFHASLKTDHRDASVGIESAFNDYK
ncbi:MAG: integrase core domain-containing protein [Thermoplasmata archaeon]